VRLMNPRDMKHDTAMLLAAPFDKPVPELSETPEARRMVNEAVALARHAVQNELTLNVIASNRIWGCAPDANRAIAERFLDVADAQGL
jgi:hypothetical protein